MCRGPRRVVLHGSIDHPLNVSSGMGMAVMFWSPMWYITWIRIVCEHISRNDYNDSVLYLAITTRFPPILPVPTVGSVQDRPTDFWMIELTTTWEIL